MAEKNRRLNIPRAKAGKMKEKKIIYPLNHKNYI
jgi:hypothetical protein